MTNIIEYLSVTCPPSRVLDELLKTYPSFQKTDLKRLFECIDLKGKDYFRPRFNAPPPSTPEHPLKRFLEVVEANPELSDYVRVLKIEFRRDHEFPLDAPSLLTRLNHVRKLSVSLLEQDENRLRVWDSVPWLFTDALFSLLRRNNITDFTLLGLAAFPVDCLYELLVPMKSSTLYKCFGNIRKFKTTFAKDELKSLDVQRIILSSIHKLEYFEMELPISRENQTLSQNFVLDGADGSSKPHEHPFTALKLLKVTLTVHPSACIRRGFPPFANLNQELGCISGTNKIEEIDLKLVFLDGARLDDTIDEWNSALTTFTSLAFPSLRKITWVINKFWHSGTKSAVPTDKLMNAAILELKKQNSDVEVVTS